ncbi:helix-turn-helix domain-containing protein [Kutzneria sp. 744]|uniref:helix-turn-helix domain-containing protein n=1 Tax=Kutzneria sp. (strain 744) TaxID=345341 RepID=UPI0004BA56C2|nr:helix-turn-helix domain-containing protein [Kutzneria sp. 744]
MSGRHLARLFTAEIGRTPAEYVDTVRVEAARALLESGTDPVDLIARRVGLGSAETLRRLFLRTLSVRRPPTGRVSARHSVDIVRTPIVRQRSATPNIASGLHLVAAAPVGPSGGPPAPRQGVVRWSSWQRCW